MNMKLAGRRRSLAGCCDLAFMLGYGCLCPMDTDCFSGNTLYQSKFLHFILFLILILYFLSSGRQLTILNKSLRAMHYRRDADMVHSTKV